MAKSSYSVTPDAILMDDQKVEPGQTLALGGISLQILFYEPEQAARGTETVVQAVKSTTFAPFTPPVTRRRIIPRLFPAKA